MVKNAVLREALEAWIQAIPDILRPITAQPEDEMRRYLKKASNSWYEFYMFNHWDSVESVSLQEGKFERLSETREIMNIVASDPVLRRVLLTNQLGDEIADASSYSWLVDRYLSRFAFTYLLRNSKLTIDLLFNNAAFEQTYDDFEQFLNSPFTAEIRLRVFLRNLFEVTPAGEMTFGEISVDESVSLKRIDHSEERLVDESDTEFGRVSILEIGDVALSAIAVEIRGPLSELGDYHDPVERERALEPFKQAAARVLDTLRLVQEGPVLAGAMRFLPGNPFMFMIREIVPAPEADRFSMETSALQRKLPDISLLSRYYQFSQEVAESVPDMYVRIQRCAHIPELRLGLRRLGDSYARANSEDAIVDCWIALEAMFAKDGKSEMTFKASLRCARFVGENEDERVELHRKLKSSYSMRSAIVHGSRAEIANILKKNPLAMEEQREFVQNILRRALTRTVQMEEAPNCDLIDRSFMKD